MTASPSMKTGAAKALAFVALIMALPFVVIAKLLVLPFERPAHRSPGEVARYLRDFRDGTGDGRDWDEFTSVSIADPALEEIRRRAASLDFPLPDEGITPLDTLITEVETLMTRAELAQ